MKICAAHGGGFLPSYANRSDAVIRCFPNRVGPLPKKNPTAYLKDGQLFFDTIVFTPEALRHLIAETGPGQIMIGTDYPFPWTSTEVDLVLQHAGPQRRASASPSWAAPRRSCWASSPERERGGLRHRCSQPQFRP